VLGRPKIDIRRGANTSEPGGWATIGCVALPVDDWIERIQLMSGCGYDAVHDNEDQR